MSDHKPIAPECLMSQAEELSRSQSNEQSSLAATASSTTDRTLTLAQDFCERTISDLNSGKATLRYETLEAFEKLCTQCGISTIRIQS